MKRSSSLKTSQARHSAASAATAPLAAVLAGSAALLMLAGCVPLEPLPPVSSAETSVAPAEQEKLAETVAGQMTKIWPPAKTTLAVTFAVDPRDAFGLSLVDRLRRSGYAVIECFEYRLSEGASAAGSKAQNTADGESGERVASHPVPVAASASPAVSPDPETVRQMRAVEVIRTTDALAQGKALAWALSPLEACLPGRSCLYRATVSVDGRRLSRAFLSTDGRMAPAGAWSLQTLERPRLEPNQ